MSARNGLGRALLLMHDHSFRHVPVVENDADYDDWFKVMVMVKAATEGLEA